MSKKTNLKIIYRLSSPAWDALFFLTAADCCYYGCCFKYYGRVNTKTNSFVYISFAAIIVLIYLIGIYLAVKSWDRYRFSTLWFVPICLSLILPVLIFPMYISAENKQKKHLGNYNPQISRIIKIYSWLPLLAAFVLSWILQPVFEFGLGISYNIVPSLCSYCVALLVILSFIWLKKELTKLENN